MADLKQLAEEIVNMTFLEAQELKAALQDGHGIELDTGSEQMKASPSPSDQATKEERIEFDVFLVNFGSNKIQVIKEVRAITGLGLKEAKSLVEKGGLIREGVSRDEAGDVKNKLEAAGAVVEIPYFGKIEEDLNALAWATADLLSLGQEARRRSESLDQTLAYVNGICSKVIRG